MEDSMNNPNAESTTGQPQDSNPTPEAVTEDGGLMVTVTDSFGQTGGDAGDTAENEGTA